MSYVTSRETIIRTKAIPWSIACPYTIVEGVVACAVIVALASLEKKKGYGDQNINFHKTHFQSDQRMLELTY